MATVLLTWELGGGMGHVVPLRVLADELAARAHRVVMAMRDLSAHTVLRGACAAILPAPSVPERPKLPIDPPYTFAHLLYNCGFDNVPALEVRVRCWLTLFDYVRPDFVVLDHRPTALLALRANKIAMAPFGVGFSIPVDEYRCGARGIFRRRIVIAYAPTKSGSCRRSTACCERLMPSLWIASASFMARSMRVF